MNIICKLVFLSSAGVAAKVGHAATVVRLVEPDQHLAATDTALQFRLSILACRPRIQQTDILGPVAEVVIMLFRWLGLYPLIVGGFDLRRRCGFRAVE